MTNVHFTGFTGHEVVSGKKLRLTALRHQKDALELRVRVDQTVVETYEKADASSIPFLLPAEIDVITGPAIVALQTPNHEDTESDTSEAWAVEEDV